MDKQQKEILESQLNDEKAVLKSLEAMYRDALAEINSKIELLMARQDADMQHVIYQVQYQQNLKTQIQAILETLQTNEFETVSEYLTKSYEEGFLGTMYTMQAQGVPLIFPIDQSQVVNALMHETKLNETLYAAMGHDIKDLQKKIAGEISRGIAGGQMYSEIARNIASWARIPKNNAMRITRTEAHRIQCKAAYDAQHKAKSRGADVVRQWDASLDGRTRDSHRKIDGEIKEIPNNGEKEEPFSNGLMYPGDPSGRPEEVINCRCALLTRARWALDREETKYLGNMDGMSDKDLKPLADKLHMSVDELRTYQGQIVPINAKSYEDFKRQYNKIWKYEGSDLQKQAEARIAGYKSERVRTGAQKMKPTNKHGEEIQFDWKGKDEEHAQQQQILSKLSNEYDTRLQKVTSGAKNSAGDVDMSGATLRLNGASVSNAIHEFAHTLANTSADKYGLTHDSDFWKEIKKVRKNYRNDVGSDTNRWISSYEHAETKSPYDEFVAEAFTLAKLDEMGMDIPSKYGSELSYAKQVLAIVNKYFKKHKN